MENLGELLKICAWSTGPVFLIFGIGKVWGVVKSKIDQHDKDISGASKEIKELKSINKEEHSNIISTLSDTRDIVKRLEGRKNGLK